MLPSGTFNTRPEQDMAIVRTRAQWILLLVGIAFCFTLGLLLSDEWLVWLIVLGMYIVAVLGLHIMTGLCGQFSMGQAAFMAVGAYTTGVLCSQYGLSPWMTLPLSGIFAGLIGLIFGTPALRIKGFYLVMATIAAQFIVIWMIRESPKIGLPTGGVYGIAVPKLTMAGESLSYSEFWWVVLAVVVVMTYFAKNIQRTRTGRNFVAIRDNDLAAEVMGINLFRNKLLAFFIGCFFAGIAGWLWAHFYGWITPNQFDFKLSLWFLGMIIIGGMGSTTGAIMGAVAIRLMDKAVDPLASLIGDAFPSLSVQVAPALSLIVFALVVVFFILVEPKGLYHRWERIKLYYRLHPFAY